MSRSENTGPKRVKVDLSKVLKPGVQLASVQPRDVTTIFTVADEQMFEIIECNFIHEFRDDFEVLQSRLLTAQSPWLQIFLQRRQNHRSDNDSRVKVSNARRLAMTLGDVAGSPEISGQDVKDAFHYREATCAAYAAFCHPQQMCVSELTQMAGSVSPVKYFERLVEASERHLASQPKPTNPSPSVDTASLVTLPAAHSSIDSSSPFTDEYLRDKVSNFIVKKERLDNVIPWADVEECGSQVKDELITSWYAVNDRRKAFRSTPPGILLHGDQGTGKTTIVYSFAAWKDLTLFEINSSVFGSLQGQSEKLIQYVFDEVRLRAAQKPCILFFDEADALLGAKASHLSTFEGMVKTLWGHLIQDKVRCFVFGATNKPWLINMADYSRRFQLKFHITKPLTKARKQVLQQSLSPFWCAVEESEYNDLATALEGYSINDISSNIDRYAAVLLRNMYESTRWIKTTKDGNDVHIPADKEIYWQKGSIETFEKTAEPRPMTVDGIVAYFKDKVVKTSSDSAEAQHREWSKQWSS